MERSLGALQGRVDRRCAVDDVVVDAVLGEANSHGVVEETRGIRLVLTEQQIRCAVAGEHQSAGPVVLPDHTAVLPTQLWLAMVGRAPGPGVAEPQRRQDMQRCLVRPGILDGDPHEQVVRPCLGVVDGDHPVPAVVEDPGVDQFVLSLGPRPPPVFGDELVVWVCPLRVVIPPGVPGMGRRAVEVPPVFLDVLAVVPLGTGQPEHAFLEDGVSTVPQRQGQAPVL